MTSAIDISLEDVLNRIVGQHYPQGDTTMDDVSARNMPKLAAIGMWVAHELSLDCGLDSYLNSPFYSMKSVAKLHDDAIMEMLARFEPQVKRYYETLLAGDEEPDTIRNELIDEGQLMTDNRTTELLPCPFCGGEIVRCRDCKHYGEKTYCFRLGEYREFYVEPDGFCAWGEKKAQ